MAYIRRLIDDELDLLTPELVAIALDGPKGVGKTATGLERASTVLRADVPEVAALLEADPQSWTERQPPILLDEWQRLPWLWDTVRRAVDDGAAPGTFLLAGSATPADAQIHSGAGRIVSLRMRPMSLPERGVARPSISLQGLLAGGKSGNRGHLSFEACRLRGRDRGLGLSWYPSSRGPRQAYTT